MKHEEGRGMLRFYMGTQSHNPAHGIYVSTLDIERGECSPPELAAGSLNPNFIAVSACGSFLYAVGGDSVPGREDCGTVTAYAVDGKRGELERLNRVGSEGRTPCHISLDRSGRMALVSNYGCGTLAVLSIDACGHLSGGARVLPHCGRGPHPTRQQSAHLHSAGMDPENNFALALDLGTDRIYSYRVDHARGRLSPNQAMPFTRLPGGSGPRHFAFSRCGNFCYAVHELDNTISVFRYDSRSGVLHPAQRVSTLPPGSSAPSYASEIRVHPNGNFLYAANRGHNSISVFGMDPAGGRLERIQVEPSGGDFPRHFSIDPSGRWLLVANERGDGIGVFRVDADSGRIGLHFRLSNIPRPACIAFSPAGTC